MKVVKGCGLALLCLVLFLLLTIFGFAFTINQVALSPGVVKGIIRDIDLAALASETFQQDTSPQTSESLSLQKSVVDTIDTIQPVVKEKLYIAIDDTYDYLRGHSKSYNLKGVLGDSFMNRDFMEKVLAKIDLTNLVGQTLSDQIAGTNDNAIQILMPALLDTIKKNGPDFKAQVATASDPVFKYLLGQTSTIDLKTTARNTFLSNTFLGTVIENVDVRTVVKNILIDQLGPLPGGVILTDNQLDRIAAILEPVVKSNLKTAAASIGDYLVGKTTDFNIIISVEPALPQIKPIITEAFLTFAPPEIQGATQAQIDAAAGNYWNQTIASFSTTLALDSTVFGSGVDYSIGQMFTSLQESLDSARQSVDSNSREIEYQLSQIRMFVNYFRSAFYGLMVLIMVIIGGIILIHRTVKGACRDLGIVFTIYGTLVFAVIMVARTVVPGIVQQLITTPPQAMIDLIPKLVQHLTSPLFAVSLICLIAGIVMLVISFVYPNMKGKKAAVIAQAKQPPHTAVT